MCVYIRASPCPQSPERASDPLWITTCSSEHREPSWFWGRASSTFNCWASLLFLFLTFIYLFILSVSDSLTVRACMHILMSVYRSEDGFRQSFPFSPHESPRNQTQDVRLGRLKPSFRPRGCLTVSGCRVLFHDWLCTFYFPEDCCHWACCMVTETSEVSTFPLMFSALEHLHLCFLFAWYMSCIPRKLRSGLRYSWVGRVNAQHIWNSGFESSASQKLVMVVRAWNPSIGNVKKAGGSKSFLLTQWLPGPHGTYISIVFRCLKW